MNWKNILFLLVIMGFFLAGGCSSKNYYFQGSELQKHWGRSYESAKYYQIIDPYPETTEPVVRLNGQAVINSMEDYRKSFKVENKGEFKNDLTEFPGITEELEMSD